MKSILMKKKSVYCALALLVLASLGTAQSESAAEKVFVKAKEVVLVATGSSEPEKKTAEILRKRLQKRSEVASNVVDGNAVPEGGDLRIAIGVLAEDVYLRGLVDSLGAKLPTLPNSNTVHPESFVVKSGEIDGHKCVVIAGADTRGALYGVGAFLRAITFLSGEIVVPEFDLVDKPAFGLRGGTATGPGSRSEEFGNLRPQTHEEYLERMEELLLVGANTIGGELDLVRTYGMQSYFGRKSNELPGGFPPEWGAPGDRSGRYVCPSIPEAKRALLEAFDRWFREVPYYEIYATKSGDPGGCRCDRCMPWGATYIQLTHEIADILHKYHPKTKVIATNQDLTNEGNLAIFGYLNTRDSSWLHAIRYGPGADEMQTYIRGPVNPRWFEYEGFGPLGNYLKYMHRELPRTTTILGFTDVTHWMQSQYGVEKPDVALAAVYDRRSWNARPRAFHRVSRDILRYMDGDLYYSEGQHDEFNKWFWHRLLWNPHLEAEQITREYCRYFFGQEAVDEMTEAIFLMEETLEKPVLGNSGIVRAVDLLRLAGKKIPENLLKDDYRWRIISQKALMDRYIQLQLERGAQLKEKAGALLAKVEKSNAPRKEIEQALKILNEPLETPEMAAILKEAQERGEESNDLVGYREAAMFIAPTMDLTEAGWWKKTLEEALASGEDDRLRNTARMILRYEDPGEGGFYENLGWPSDSPHLVHGETLWGFDQFPGPAKRSHYNLGYARGQSGRGLTFAYDGLDTDSEYVVRLSVKGRQRPGAEEFQQGLEADGQVITDAFPVSLTEIGYHEFALPKEATQDGRVEIALTSPSAERPYTVANEIWLMRKDSMPWTSENGKPTE
jgi:hypothetical protein